MTQSLSTAEQTYNQSMRGQRRETLIWLTVRNIETGDPFDVGYWTGRHDRSFVISGQSRLYHGAGAALDIDDIEGAVGMNVRYQRARLSIRPDTEATIRGYDPRLAPVQIHSVAFDLDTNAPIAEPRRVFKGEVNEVTINLPPSGGDGAIELRLASSARILTRTLALFKSDAEMRRRDPFDQFRKHVSTTGIRAVAWGEELAAVR